MKYKSKPIKQKAYDDMNWERRMFILVKKNQNWAVRDIAKKLDISTQRVYQILEHMKDMSVKELETEYQNYLLTSSK
jgi:predicted ArsR family transcriptional regulator